jgi:hypothetical protein
MAKDILLRIREGFRSAGDDDFGIRQHLASGARQLVLLESLSDSSASVASISESAEQHENAETPTWPWQRDNHES